jgi:hypothetical protein
MIVDAITELMKNELSGEAIEDICGGRDKVRIMTSKDFIASMPNLLDETLPDGQPMACVVLYENSNTNTCGASADGHWVSILRHPTRLVEYFDPYGLPIDYALKGVKGASPLSERIAPVLQSFCSSNSLKLVQNHSVFQMPWRTNRSATCGRWAAIRVVMRGMTIEQFRAMFDMSVVKSDPALASEYEKELIKSVDSDWIVTALTEAMINARNGERKMNIQ